MLYYPKIPGSRNCPDGRCIAFEKLDGTNLHWEWDRDFGWHAFGTRRDSFNLTPDGIGQFQRRHEHLAECAGVFEELGAMIEAAIRNNAAYDACQSLTAFTEFLGQGSFAGLHKSGEQKQLCLFDVSTGTDGILGPHRFVADFGHLPIPKVVYQGKLTGKFADDVRTGKYGVEEGVVCKGGTGGDDLWMVKIKTNAYMEKLKQAFADRWEEFWE